MSSDTGSVPAIEITIIYRHCLHAELNKHLFKTSPHATNLLQLVQQLIMSLLCERTDLLVRLVHLTQFTEDWSLRLTTTLHRRVYLRVQFLNHWLLVVQALL